MSSGLLETLSPEDRAELDAMSRMIERAQAFVLAFVVINHPSLRDALIEAYRAEVCPGAIMTVKLNSTTLAGIVAQIEREVDSAGEGSYRAAFVTGLESMLEIAGSPLPYLEDLNLSRSYC